ncbi:MAG TPA: hypothetical protein ENK68_03980 [Epsilonproteobacteria bacterium]|nr:hypothetical protein [Campylobacterota bacterium]
MQYFFLLLSLISVVFSQPYNDDMLYKIENIEETHQSFSFAVYGDNRGRDDILATIIKTVDSDRDILFSISNGDVVTTSFKYQFQNYLSLLQQSKKPILTVLGNHGIGLLENDINFKTIFGHSYFSFVLKNSYFIILDDADDETMASKQFLWLQKELRKAQTYDNRFIIMHIPLYDPRAGAYAQGHSLEDMKQVKQLNDLFDRYKVTMLFTSHIHSYYRGVWHKTPYIISGGAGAPLIKGGFFHYIKVTVTGTEVEYKIIKIKT